MADLLIEMRWQAETPWHVGSGAVAASLADKPLLKDANNRPLVPGSSVRGKARHACEQVARSLPGWRWSEVCLPPYQFCRDDPCWVCELFGTEVRKGKVRFTDLRLEFAEGLSVRDSRDLLDRAGRSDVRWSVGLSRMRGTAEDDLLYSVETHAPNPALALRGAVHGRLGGEKEIRRKQAAFLVAGLRAVQSLGGNRTRGLGWGHFALDVRLDGENTAVEDLAREVAGW